ncbi:MAG TPA: hypothetical protein VHQ66_00030 [Myxococcota bacterium]|nr:hypothetical protein [Myxococcota bacterium]
MKGDARTADAFDPEACAGELCRVFVGWKLREDEDALAALGEGALRIDLLSGESWCDGEPLPALFIAGELARTLASFLERAGAAPGTVSAAELHAEFAAVPRSGGGPPSLRIACRAALRTASGTFAGSAQRG